MATEDARRRRVMAAMSQVIARSPRYEYILSRMRTIRAAPDVFSRKFHGDTGARTTEFSMLAVSFAAYYFRGY